SRKCETPQTSVLSSREPVLTKKPTATDCAAGLSSPMMVRPLGRVWWWKVMAFWSQESEVRGQRSEVRGQRSGNLVVLLPVVGAREQLGRPKLKSWQHV